jgi:hypothetical protein
LFDGPSDACYLYPFSAGCVEEGLDHAQSTNTATAPPPVQRLAIGVDPSSSVGRLLGAVSIYSIADSLDLSQAYASSHRDNANHRLPLDVLGRTPRQRHLTPRQSAPVSLARSAGLGLGPANRRGFRQAVHRAAAKTPPGDMNYRTPQKVKSQKSTRPKETKRPRRRIELKLLAPSGSSAGLPARGSKGTTRQFGLEPTNSGLAVETRLLNTCRDVHFLFDAMSGRSAPTSRRVSRQTGARWNCGGSADSLGGNATDISVPSLSRICETAASRRL